MTAPPMTMPAVDTETVPPELMPNYDAIIIEDGKPVDSIVSEKQMRLLTEPLYTAWGGPGEGRPFIVLANVGLFYHPRLPALVPDVMLSLDVQVPQDMALKQNRSYFIWEYGKPPDVVIEIVSNREGGELDRKLQEYGRQGVAYYGVYDPHGYLLPTPLRLFGLRARTYTELEEATLPDVGLGLTLWTGVFEGLAGTWLRWTDPQGQLIPTGAERSEQERQRAERAEQEVARLRAPLRELGLAEE